MARSTGLAPRRGGCPDADTILLGAVGPGTRGRAAVTRTGAAMMLTTRLEAYDVVKFKLYGATANVAGGYLVQVANVAEGALLASASTYATVAAIEGSGIATREVAVSGAQIRAAVAAAGSLTGDIRCVAIRLVAGTGSNGAAVPAGTMTVSVEPVNQL